MLIDGAAVCSCIILAAQVEGAEVTTIEGLGTDHPLLAPSWTKWSSAESAPRDDHGRRDPRSPPSLEKIRTGLAGNLCRCTGYEAIYRAIRKP